MLRSLVSALVLVVSFQALAQDKNLFVLQDGSVARCHQNGDANNRAFRMQIVESQAEHITIKLETLVCAEVEGKLKLVPFALADQLVFTNEEDNMSYELVNPYISVTNFESTVELGQVKIDATKTAQQFTLPASALSEKQISLTIMALDVIKKNGVLFDQGLTYGGHYSLIKK